VPKPKKRKKSASKKKRAPATKAKAKAKPSHDPFWTIIDAHRDGDDYDEDGLIAELAKGSKEDILAFDARVTKLMDESYRGDLWGAAYVANGGCSDDGFDYFRGWLISRGKAVFEAALADPDSIVSEVGEGDVEVEGLLYAAAHAWELKTGKDDFYDHAEERDDEDDDEEDGDLDLSWSEDGDGVPERLAKAYPRLWKKFGD
jgi:hypothetical protein